MGARQADTTHNTSHTAGVSRLRALYMPSTRTLLAAPRLVDVDDTCCEPWAARSIRGQAPSARHRLCFLIVAEVFLNLAKSRSPHERGGDRRAPSAPLAALETGRRIQALLLAGQAEELETRREGVLGRFEVESRRPTSIKSQVRSEWQMGSVASVASG